MIRKLNLLILGIFVTLFTFFPVYATSVNSYTSNSINSDVVATSTTSGNSINTKTSSLTTSTLPEADLGFNNILCILLIVIGVVLILLGVAVLIRLKK